MVKKGKGWHNNRCWVICNLIEISVYAGQPDGITDCIYGGEQLSDAPVCLRDIITTPYFTSGL